MHHQISISVIFLDFLHHVGLKIVIIFFQEFSYYLKPSKTQGGMCTYLQNLLPIFRDLLGPDAVYVTILRHPVDLFESLYAYTNFQTVLKLSLHEYIAR